MIKYHEQDQGEALLEFLYAVATNKLSLKLPYIAQLIELIKKNCKEEILLEFGAYRIFIDHRTRKKTEGMGGKIETYTCRSRIRNACSVILQRKNPIIKLVLQA